MAAQSRQNTKRRQLLVERAQGMRVNATWSERVLWEDLSGNKLGVSFRRLHTESILSLTKNGENWRAIARELAVDAMASVGTPDD